MGRLPHLARRHLHRPRGQPPRQVHGRGGERVDLVPAGRRRVDQGAHGGRGPAGRRARPGGHPVPARVGPHAGRPAEDRRGRRAPDAKNASRQWWRTAPPRRRAARARATRAAARPAGNLPEGCAGPTTPIPGQPDGYAPFVGPICSQDGKAAIVTAYLKGDGESDDILDPVDFWRDTVSDPGGGLEVKITGGAGYAADAIKVFEGINGTLLLAAVSLVIFLLIVIYRSPIFFWIPLAAVIFAEMLARSRGLRPLRAGRDDQRPVELDHVGPRARRRHGLRTVDRGQVPRGAARHRGPARGHAGGDDICRAGRVRVGRDRHRGAALPEHREGQRHVRDSGRSERWAWPARPSPCSRCCRRCSRSSAGARSGRSRRTRRNWSAPTDVAQSGIGQRIVEGSSVGALLPVIGAALVAIILLPITVITALLRRFVSLVTGGRVKTPSVVEPVRRRRSSSHTRCGGPSTSTSPTPRTASGSAWATGWRSAPRA